MNQLKKFTVSLDWLLIGVSLSIPLIGLMVLYSASYDPEFGRSPLFIRQLTFFIGGFILALVTASIPPRFWFRVSYLLYGISFLLLIAVLVNGTITNGSKRWLSLGVFNLQPSELMKVGLILALGRYLSKAPPKRGVYGLTELIVPAMIILVPMAIIFRQPDLGTALTVVAIGGTMILFVGVRRWILGSSLVIGIAGAVFAWNKLLKPYQIRRIKTLFDPESDPHGAGWQIMQSKIAVGSGELFGKGYLQGSQTQLEFIPERTTDFIFSVLAEEWGFIGSLLVVGMYFFLLARVLQGVIRSKDYFGALVGVGVVSFIFFHTFVNLGMVVGFLPVVGLPLPLFSYGGSSMLTTFFAIGLVLSLTSSKSVFSSR